MGEEPSDIFRLYGLVTYVNTTAAASYADIMLPTYVTRAFMKSTPHSPSLHYALSGALGCGSAWGIT